MRTPTDPTVPRHPVRWAEIGLTALAGALHLRALAAEEPWFDEAFSIVVASGSLRDLWALSLADQVHPPGFSLLLWLWMRLGSTDLAWLRLFPALAATLSVPALMEAGRAVRLSPRAILAAGALAATSPLLLEMSRELRTYAPLVLVTTLTLIAVLRRQRVRIVGGYVVLAGLHYFGALAVAALVGGAIVRDRPRWRTALVEALPAAALLSAWLALVVGHARGDVGPDASWIPAVGLAGVVDLPIRLVGTFATPAGTLLVIGVFVCALALTIRDRALAPIIALGLLPPALTIALEALSGRHLWVVRYLIIVGPAWWLLIAAGIDRLTGWGARLGVIALVGWAALAGVHAEAARPRKPTWSAVARALAGRNGITLCAHEDYVALPLRYQAVSRRIPLRIVGLARCNARTRPDGYLLRPGTEAILQTVASRGATLGAPRDLGTDRPATLVIPLRW